MPPLVRISLPSVGDPAAVLDAIAYVEPDQLNAGHVSDAGPVVSVDPIDPLERVNVSYAIQSPYTANTGFDGAEENVARHRLIRTITTLDIYRKFCFIFFIGRSF
jgi:hypothetical protein